MEDCDYCFQKAFIFISNNSNIKNGNYCGICFFKKNNDILIKINGESINFQKENPILVIDKEEKYIFILYENKINSYLKSKIRNENSYVNEIFFDECYSQCSEKVHFDWEDYLEHIRTTISKYETFDRIVLIKDNKTEFLTKEDLKIHYDYL